MTRNNQLYRVVTALLVFCSWLFIGVAHADTVTYYHTDALGTPVMESNATGQVTYSREHRPYGEQAVGAAKNGPGFTGHVGDADTGLTYMQARYSDPVSGRFLSVDPASADASSGANFNRYWYANNNPYKFTDPDGCLPMGGGVPTGEQLADGQDFTMAQQYAGGSGFGAPKHPRIGNNGNGSRERAAAAAAGVARPAAGAGAGGASATGWWGFIRGLLGRAVITTPLVIGGDSRKVPTIVIGEGMTTRVIPYALGAGAEYYNPPPAPESMWMENNRVWINQKMNQEYRIIDIGPERGRANYPSATSPYYLMELTEIANRGYPTYKVTVP